MSVYRRGVGAAAVALTTVVFCAGCLGLTSGGTASEPASLETQSPTAADASVQQTPEELPLGVSDGDVVATGELTSPDGSVNGSVRVVSVGNGNYHAEFEDLAITRDGLMSVAFSVEPWDEQRYCDEAFMTYGYGDTDLVSTPVTEFWYAEHMGDDPSFLDTLLVTQGIDDPNYDGCYYPVVATAPLNWTMPDQRPDLAPEDTGETGGARGVVEIVDGVPASYTVAPDDILDEVAARFGVSVKDLWYLNPGRDQNPVLDVNEVLNLAKASR